MYDSSELRLDLNSEFVVFSGRWHVGWNYTYVKEAVEQWQL
jgi:hypothetical protein